MNEIEYVSHSFLGDGTKICGEQHGYFALHVATVSMVVVGGGGIAFVPQGSCIAVHWPSGTTAFSVPSKERAVAILDDVNRFAEAPMESPNRSEAIRQLGKSACLWMEAMVKAAVNNEPHIPYREWIRTNTDMD